MADERITLGADSKEAQIAFLQLKDVVEQFIASLGKTGPEADKASAELTDMFSKAGLSAQEAAKNLPKFYDQFNQGTQSATFSFKELTRSFAGGIGVIQLVQKNLQDMKPIAEDLAKGFDTVAESIGLTGTTADSVKSKLGALLNPMKIGKSIAADWALANERLAEELSKVAEEIVGAAAAAPKLTEAQQAANDATRDALKLQRERSVEHEKESSQRAALAQVLVREAEAQRAAGAVTAETKKEIEQLNQALVDSGEAIPPAFSKIVSELGILTEEQEKNKESAQKLAEEAEKAATKRAEAEEKASAKAVEALRKETEARKEAMAEAEKATAEAQARADAAEAELQSPAGNADAKRKEIAELESELKELREKPGGLDANELKKQTELEDQLAQARFDAANSQVEAAEDVNDQLGKFYDARAELQERELDQSILLGEELQRQHDRVIDSLENLEGGYSDFSDTLAGDAGNFSAAASTVEYVGDAAADAGTEFEGLAGAAELAGVELGGAFSDAESSVENVGDAATDTAKAMDGVADAAKDVNQELGETGETEGLSKLSDDADIVIPKLETIRNLLDQIVAKAAEAEL